MDQSIPRSTEAELADAKARAFEPDASAADVAYWLQLEATRQRVEPKVFTTWLPWRTDDSILAAEDQYDHWLSYVVTNCNRLIPRWQFFGEEHGYDGPAVDGPPLRSQSADMLLSRLEAEREAASEAVTLRSNAKVCSAYDALWIATDSVLQVAATYGKRIAMQFANARHS